MPSLNYLYIIKLLNIFEIVTKSKNLISNAGFLLLFYYPKSASIFDLIETNVYF